MTFSSSTRRRLVLAIALATLAGSICLMTAVFAHPKSVSSGILGADWQCQQILWLTSCTRVEPVEPITPAMRSGHEEPVGLRQV
jgi:hypothetical protein